MKKIVCSLAIITLFSGTAIAQEFRFGLTASPLFSWFRVGGEEVESDGPRIGFQYGLIFEPTIGSVERYAFTTGVIVNITGGNLYSTDTSGKEYYSTVKSQYIEIPLAVKLRTNEVNYMTYYGLFGITPGMNIQARYHLEDGDGNVIIEDDDIRDPTSGDDYNFFNLSLSVGAGVEYAMTENTAITGGIFFQNGFLNVMDNSSTD
jgi:opacity protein-like surface antigen